MYHFFKRLLTIIFSLALIALALTACSGFPEVTIPKEQKLAVTPTPMDARTAEIDAAFKQAVSNREDVLAFLLYNVTIEKIDFNEDGTMALVWYGLADRETGETIPGETSLALGIKNDGTWRIVVQADADWAEQLGRIPDTLLNAESKARYMPDIQQVPKDHQIFTGYRLPWPGGTARRVSGSVGHVFTYKTCPSTCLYAFDFADGTMFPIVAARGGTVKYAVWNWPNGNTEHTNYIILEDTTTTPTTYQVYYHLAQDSIPVNLRTPGTPVYQGQFIGNVDDTGASSGHHLHFHVHTRPNSVWGTSVDIVFEDVADNGGRPRTCVEASQFPDYGSQCSKGNWYTSNNYGDDEPPTGDLTLPAAGQVINTAVMNVSGWGSDNKGVASLQVLANWDGTWKKIGAPQTISPFNLDVNVCEAGIPDGPFLLALEAKDISGRISTGPAGQRTLEKSFNCNPDPTPEPCLPGPKQIALYADKNFQGECQLFGMGDFKTGTALGSVGANNAESVRVGADVMALVYERDNFEGDHGALIVDMTDLADSLPGNNAISSLSVQPRLPAPSEPVISAPRNKADLPPTELDLLTLRWKGDEASLEFRAELNGPGGLYRPTEWQKDSSWEVGALPPGDYTLVVTARNPVGESRSSLRFSVAEMVAPPTARLEAVSGSQQTTAILLRWNAVNDEKSIDHFQIQYRMDGGDWMDWDRPLQAALRQAWFIGQGGHKYEFRLRAIGIKGDAVPFEETPDVSFTIQAECTPDEFEGENPGDDEFISSSPLEIDEKQAHNLCGEGDADWIAFPAKEGEAYQISTTPLSGGAAVNIQLYAPDGYNQLGEARPTDLAQPAILNWTSPRDGIYFVRFTPYDPGLMGNDARYEVRVNRLSQVYTPTLLCSSLLLPVIWVLVRAYLKAKRKKSSY